MQFTIQNSLNSASRFRIPDPLPTIKKLPWQENSRARYSRFVAQDERCATLLSALVRMAVINGGMSSSKELIGKDRQVYVNDWRQAIFIVLRAEKFSLSSIGRLMHRDHTSVRSGIIHAKAVCADPESSIARHVVTLQKVAAEWRVNSGVA